MRALLGLLLLSFLLHFCSCDVYLHNPPGSNDRNCEKDANRKNAHRLFDSENNAAGGYACPYNANNQLYFYSGSQLRVEWTQQHGCGNGRTKCDIILQYMCSDTIRDGYPNTPDNNADGTDRIPEDANAPQHYGMHEDFAYYTSCKQRQRNKGIWIADRQLPNDRGATITRQNNNGERFGFECPEERDYYPYWHPTPWKDIAILTDDPDNRRCDYYKAESQNVVNKGVCKYITGPEPKLKQWPNNEADCKAENLTWVMEGAWKLPAPDCLNHKQASRENNLGNVGPTLVGRSAATSFYNWAIPAVESEQKCVLRLRYNVTPGDLDGQPPKQYIDWTSNGKNSTFTQDPFIYYNDKLLLSLKINTNQFGRTFQDRTYVFRILKKPQKYNPASTIYNLNVRGKRGNIVQTFPAVEYDFVPNNLVVQVMDYVHFQWIGSDYNPRRGPNDAEGGPGDVPTNLNENARADRSNIVEMAAGSNLIPLNYEQLSNMTMFVDEQGRPDWTTIRKLSYLDQNNCMSEQELRDNKNKREKERSPHNCAKINTASPYFDAGPVQMRKMGVFYYMSSRNNNFSNRDQKGTIAVVPDTSKFDPNIPDAQSVPVDWGALMKSNGKDLDNLYVSDQEAVFATNALFAIPTQYKDNEYMGRGVGKWNATVSDWIAATAADQNRRVNFLYPDQPEKVSTQAVGAIAVFSALAGISSGFVVGWVYWKKSSGPTEI